MDLKYKASVERCKQHRQQLINIIIERVDSDALSAHSCLEVMEVLYYQLMRRNSEDTWIDQCLLSNNHGHISQYIILRSIKKTFLNLKHQDAVSSSIQPPKLTQLSLEIALGMSLSNQLLSNDSRTFLIMPYYELQQGDIWSTIQLAGRLKLNNLTVFLDLNFANNTLQSLDSDKIINNLISMGWYLYDIDGHDIEEIYSAAKDMHVSKPVFILFKSSSNFCLTKTKTPSL